jgi:hypothetical protein
MKRNPLRDFFEVAFLLMSVGAPGRYKSDNVFPFGIDHVENAAFNHAYDHKPFFVIVLPVIKNFYGKRVVKHALSQFKTDTVFGEVVLSFGLIPFEC